MVVELLFDVVRFLLVQIGTILTKARDVFMTPGHTGDIDCVHQQPNVAAEQNSNLNREETKVDEMDELRKEVKELDSAVKEIRNAQVQQEMKVDETDEKNGSALETRLDELDQLVRNDLREQLQTHVHSVVARQIRRAREQQERTQNNQRRCAEHKEQNEYREVIKSCITAPEQIDDITFEDIIGVQDVKDLFQEWVLEDIGSSAPLGCNVLLYGPPGTGKTRIAKAVAKKCGVSFLAPKAKDLLDSKFGASDKLVEALFECATNEAKKSDKKAAIIFIDEVDSLLTSRENDTGGGASGASRRVKTAFLMAMDGLKTPGDMASKIKLYIIAATNYDKSLDSAVLSRFQQKMYVAKPSQSERVAMIKLHLENIGCKLDDEKTDDPDDPDDPRCTCHCDDGIIDPIASDAIGFSGRDLKSLCDTAQQLAKSAARHGPDKSSAARKPRIDLVLFKKALSSIQATLTDAERKISHCIFESDLAALKKEYGDSISRHVGGHWQNILAEAGSLRLQSFVAYGPPKNDHVLRQVAGGILYQMAQRRRLQEEQKACFMNVDLAAYCQYGAEKFEEYVDAMFEIAKCKRVSLIYFSLPYPDAQLLQYRQKQYINKQILELKKVKYIGDNQSPTLVAVFWALSVPWLSVSDLQNDLLLNVGVLGTEARKQVLQDELGDLKVVELDDTNFAELAKITENYTKQDIADVCRTVKELPIGGVEEIKGFFAEKKKEEYPESAESGHVWQQCFGNLADAKKNVDDVERGLAEQKLLVDKLQTRLTQLQAKKSVDDVERELAEQKSRFDIELRRLSTQFQDLKEETELERQRRPKEFLKKVDENETNDGDTSESTSESTSGDEVNKRRKPRKHARRESLEMYSPEKFRQTIQGFEKAAKDSRS